MRALISTLLTLYSATASVMACQPLPPEAWEYSVKRVKSNFDSAQFVVTAYVTDVRKVTVADHIYPDFKFPVERAKFRVEESFKGKLKSGDTFTIETGRTSCGLGVLSHSWIPFIPGRTPSPQSEYPMQWLIYYTPLPVPPGHPVDKPLFEIVGPPRTSPVEMASYDIEVLRKSARQWARRR